MNSKKAILFEPWNLGDVMIVLAIALQAPHRLSIACSSKWHELIRSVTEGMVAPELISTDLGYVTRNKNRSFKFKDLPTIPTNDTVLSIRGDARDYYAARTMFPNSRIVVRGWLPFIAKRVPLFDIPFANEWFPIRNCYRAWASLAKVEWSDVARFYEKKQPIEGDPLVVVHVGAQWRSRQFPDVARLVDLLKKSYNVQIVAGPGDPVPYGVDESDVLRLVNGELADMFRSSSYVITNDSGPMHLAALLRCRIMVVTRQAAIREWLPPTAIAVESQYSPKGYRSAPLSDSIASGWPTADEVLEQFEKCADR
jgi:hypothetical protein